MGISCYEYYYEMMSSSERAVCLNIYLALCQTVLTDSEDTK